MESIKIPYILIETAQAPIQFSLQNLVIVPDRYKFFVFKWFYKILCTKISTVSDSLKWIQGIVHFSRCFYTVISGENVIDKLVIVITQ